MWVHGIPVLRNLIHENKVFQTRKHKCFGSLMGQRSVGVVYLMGSKVSGSGLFDDAIASTCASVAVRGHVVPRSTSYATGRTEWDGQTGTCSYMYPVVGGRHSRTLHDCWKGRKQL